MTEAAIWAVSIMALLLSLVSVGFAIATYRRQR
jgi:hypothetical protein